MDLLVLVWQCNRNNTCQAWPRQINSYGLVACRPIGQGDSTVGELSDYAVGGEGGIDVVCGGFGGMVYNLKRHIFRNTVLDLFWQLVWRSKIQFSILFGLGGNDGRSRPGHGSNQTNFGYQAGYDDGP